jgi:hypothetical protein|nr:MAG TPA: hypothetical protein [Caudoviricetes sp.]
MVEVTRTSLSRQTKTSGCVLCYVRARKAARALHNTHPSKTKKGEERKRKRKRKARRGKERRGEEKEQRVVLDGGGARLADAATRHHLTQHKQQKRKRNSSEQNKQPRTQTIPKTSTRQSTSHGHHTLPSMRSKTPIPQQWTTQTQQCRGRPHNPSITRRNQPPRQRQSPLRQMQQQTRQRTTQ